ncbi:MAG: stage II sporulation protein P [Ruminococcaceae bacterium]|nr:stage II sporulation protein P [Oscillospiraceae bacterium]
MKGKRRLRAVLSAALAVSTLWAVSAAATAQSLDEAARTLGGDALPILLLRFERGELFSESALSPGASLVLRAAPLLLSREAEVTRSWLAAEPPETPPAPEEPDAPAMPAEEVPASEPESAPKPPSAITVRDNGVPSTTLRPSDPSGYLVKGAVYVNNGSASSLSAGDLDGGFSAALTGDAPQVLIVHTHGCEAYTMPEGEEYEESDEHRTLDEAYNVVRVGDEIARTLEAAGIGVVHDRTLHDYPNYSGAYNRSLATIERYREEYPSITYVFDVHRDSITDADGNEYKVLCAEEPSAAQLEFVIGSDGGGLPHDRWRDNLRLACAVQETLLRGHPTLLRPIVVRNSRYNQQVCPGALLLEVGSAGNSLAEALNAARLFAEGFAETVKTNSNQPDG